MAHLSTLLADPEQPSGPSAVAYLPGDAVVIAVNGGLDHAGVAALDRTLTQVLDERHRCVVLDLHTLRSLEPDALGLLWAALRGSMRRGGTLAAAGLCPPLRPVAEPLTPHGLRLYSTVRAALAATQDPEARP
jgi:anti-anti-sigma factor